MYFVQYLKNVCIYYFIGSDDKSKSISKMLNEPDISSRLCQETFVCIKLESNTDSYKQFAEICILFVLLILQLRLLFS